MAKSNKELMIERFKDVKRLGWVPSRRRNNTGIGKTFEDYVGVVENNLDQPDLFGFEIKSHRADATNYVTLFTKAPEYPRKANAILLQKYGVPDKDYPDLPVLHTSIFANKFNTYKNKLSFKLFNDRANRKIVIQVFDLNHNLIDSSVGYSYDTIEDILRKKLNDLFYVSAQRRWNNGDEEFYFDYAEIYSEPSLEKFLDLVDRGLIMFDIRIGSYKSGSKYGKPHDHGSGFRILEENIHLLYDKKEVVN